MDEKYKLYQEALERLSAPVRIKGKSYRPVGAEKLRNVRGRKGREPKEPVKLLLVREI